MTAYAIGLVAACILDQLLADPRWFPHPVILIGGLAARVEHWMRRRLTSLRFAGCLTVAVVLAVTAGSTLLPLLLVHQVSPLLADILAAFLLYTTFAARGLAQHAMAVHEALADDRDLGPARKAVGMIVGRETAELDGPSVTRACVESVAENMSDGMIAPLIWSFAAALAASAIAPTVALIAGACGALTYKAVNTMDSMFGYKNERYQIFGWCPARLDDLANFLPARLTALIIVVAALTYGRAGCALATMLRDGSHHSSPNAGYPEAAMAGALGIQLGGASTYFGEVIAKATLGRQEQQPGRQHIRQACALLTIGSIGTVLLLAALAALL